MGTTTAQKKLFFNLKKLKNQIAPSQEGDLKDEQVDEIAIGTRVGVEVGDDEWFGVVVEFDEEDEDIVVVKREDDDEEYEVEWDSLFMPDDE